MICPVCVKEIGRIQPRLKTRQGDIHLGCAIAGGIPKILYTKERIADDFDILHKRVQDLERRLDTLEIRVR